MAPPILCYVTPAHVIAFSDKEFEQAKAAILAGEAEQASMAAAAAQVQEWELPLNKRTTITGARDD